MQRSVQTSPAEKFNTASKLSIVLLCLAAMIGCQGVSTSGNTSANIQVQSGTVSFSGTSLDFGSVTAGTSKALTMTVSNTGTESVTVSSVTFSSQYFSMTAPTLPTAILAGQSIPVTVVFSPNAAGTFNATATVVSNATNTPATFSLTGTGITSGQLAVNPGNESFGSVTIGTTSTQTVTLTNNTTSTVNVSQVAVSGTGFSISGVTTPVAISASQSTTFKISFAPKTAGAATGTVTITSDAPNPSISMPLTGTGVTLGTLSANPTSLSFGTVTTGTSEPLAETVTNTGGSSLTISQVAISGTGFTVSGITVPVTLAAGQSAGFTVTFAPTAAGSASGNVTITSNGSNPTLSIALSGTGSTIPGQLAVSPSPIAIGSVYDNVSGTATGTLSATGANVTVTAATSSNSRFTISGLSLPAVVPSGQSVSFTVTYSPLVAGADSSTLTFTSNAQTPTITDTATGTGVADPPHSVSLSWTASTSSNISGYNIYRSIYTTACGAFTKINGNTLNPTTTYTDSTVTDGTNYCYATTAVNSSNVESSYSNIVTNVQVPLP